MQLGLSGKRVIDLLVLIGLCAFPLSAQNAPALVPITSPLLISHETSTRAVAIDSLSFTPEPFALTSPNAAGSDRRTRVMLFAMHLSLQPGDELSLVTADAEDAAHQHYNLTVEYVGPVPQLEWLSAVVLKLNDNLGDVGDVLIRVSYRGINSNRVRVGIGHLGGGPADDLGSTPTPVRPFAVNGQIRDDNNLVLAGVELTLTDRTDGTTSTATTDGQGEFFFGVWPAHSFTVTPSTTAVFSFNPQAVERISDNRVLNFSGVRQEYTISGTLTGQQNQSLAGVTVNLNGPELRTTVTDSNGHYQFTHQGAGVSYTVTASSTVDYSFTGQTIPQLSGDQTLNFAGLYRPILKGTVRDEFGNAIGGVTLTLSGSESDSTITAQDGSYSLRATANGTYSLTPSMLQNPPFDPPGKQFVDLVNTQTADFTVTLIPVAEPFYVLEYDGAPKTVDYGQFWQEGVNLGHFFWEFWAMPGPNAGATYLLSDGYGGAHALLFGVGSFNTSEPDRYEMLGNTFDGVRFDNFFASDQGPAIGEWAHFAVGWDGQSIITYYNGVPVGKTAFHGPRRTPGFGQGGGRLLIGGSDHSNFDGRIAQVRGYEDTNPREDLPGGVESSFAPQTIFGLGGSLLSYYFRQGPIVADLSHGYNAITHSGRVRGTTAGILADCVGCPPPQFVIDPSAPNFVTGVAPPPTTVPPAATPPDGALVFDSFSRANSTYTFGGHGGLSSTESGSAGTQVWQTNQATANPQPFGILNGRAVLLANSTAVAWVYSGSDSGNVDVRVNRVAGRWGSGIHTGLSFRVVDANNFFFAYTADSGGTPNNKIIRVGYYQNGQRVDLTGDIVMPSSWTTLRVVTRQDGDLEVYVDSDLVYSINNSKLAAATGAGLYSDSVGMGLVNRWDNFTVSPAP